jgi:amino acid transporter
MSLFSNFAISFSIICILAGGISAFPAAFNSAGSGGAFLIWLIGGAVAMTVAFGMGQIASSFPTAGGLYHWSSHLGGKAWGWATAWLNLLGLVFVVSSVDVGVYLLFKDLFLATALGVDVSLGRNASGGWRSAYPDHKDLQSLWHSVDYRHRFQWVFDLCGRCRACHCFVGVLACCADFSA